MEPTNNVVELNLDLAPYTPEHGQPIGNCKPCEGRGRVQIIVDYARGPGAELSRIYQPSGRCPGCHGTGQQH